MATDDRPLFHGIDEKEEEYAGEAPHGDTDTDPPSLGLKVPPEILDSNDAPDDPSERRPEANDPDPLNIAER